ncbi:fimbrial protein, partial [Bordetella pseudohinzii]
IECVKIATASLAVASMMSVPPAHAVDGTITINGEITDQTCKIEGQDPPYNLLVNLPKIGTKALKDVNSTAGATPFTIKLTDCPSTLSGDVKAYFEPGSSTDYGTGNLIAYTTAAPVAAAVAAIPSPAAAVFDNVQIQLVNLNGNAIKLGTDVQHQQAQAATLTANGGSKQATLRYLARYIKSGAGGIKAGKLVTYVQYSIVYP